MQTATRSQQDISVMREYYLKKRDVAGEPKTIYEIWEEGGAFNDSITPSTASPEYRSHMFLKLLSLTGAGSVCLSLGCGNAFVEADLVQAERTVLAVDSCEEAVTLAQGKGVDAWTADIYDVSPDDLGALDVVYADGLLGHLFNPTHALEPFVAKLRTLQMKPGAWLVISNDAPADPNTEVLPHPHVPDFWFFSKTYLAQVFAAAGLEIYESYYFPYMRPISGLRRRTICVARVS